VAKQKPKTEKVYKECLKCKLSKEIKSNFYVSNSENHDDGRYPVCKTCIRKNLNITKETEFFSAEFLDVFQNTLLEMNRPFIYTLYVSSVEEHQRVGKELFGLYIKNVVFNLKTLTWKDSEFNDTSKSEVLKNDAVEIVEPEIIQVDNKNKDDVIRMLGYDPFEFEVKEDRPHLYNKLVDFLDESTLEDGFKLQAVIEIVKGFNQIDKINNAITNITSDPAKLSTNAGGIKSLIDSKKNILASLLKLAEDNGISVKHNNQKSKGAGTLSGIIKTLNEKGIEDGEVNLFDIETAKGMKQVADISNQSIMAQLQFDENDYTSMIMEQRDIIQELDSKVMKLEEENRLIKKELMKYKGLGGDMHEQT